MQRIVIFDLDGTLVDTPAVIVEAFTAAFTVMGHEPAPAAAVRATIGLPLDHVFASLTALPVDHDQVAEGVRQYRARYADLILPKAAELVFPGVLTGLTALRESGATLAVATSKTRDNAIAMLDAAGIGEQFAAVVGADSVSKPKPDPESLDLVLRERALPPAQTVMVGDTTHDTQMAFTAGVPSIAVTYGIHSSSELATAQPTWFAHTFTEVVTTLRTHWTANQPDLAQRHS